MIYKENLISCNVYRCIPAPENSTMLARNKSMSALLDSHTNQLRVKEESSPIPILPHPVTTTTTLILTTHSHTVQANLNDQVS